MTTTSTEQTKKQTRSPSPKRAQTRLEKEKARGFPLPLLLTCTVTGKVVKYTSIPYIKKLIEKYGSIEAAQKSYVSLEGRKQSKPVKAKKVVTPGVTTTVTD